MLGAFAALLVTIGVLVVTLRLLGRLQGVTPRSDRGAPMRVLQRVSTGPRQGVVMLRVADRVLIVGVGDGHTLLGELDGEARAEMLAAERTAAPTSKGPRIPGLGWLGLVLALVALPSLASAQVITAPKPVAAKNATVSAPVKPSAATPNAPTMDLRVGQGGQELKLSGAVGIVVLMGALTLLPAIFMLMTGFTRILIVLSFLRSALGTQSAPPTQLLVAIAIILTGVVMQPTLVEANASALQPYLRGEIGQVQAYEAAIVPLRKFMLANTRERDLTVFTQMTGSDTAKTIDQVPTMTVVSAFVTSELRTAFQMGFVIFLPFLVIDLIVASVLMSLGMFMLPPVMVSLPFKLLLFVLADGWALVMQNLVASFRV
ncbi:MAG: flagellar type III secretion system pore protein FliP [Gemmatimonadales bacterium]